MIQPVRWLSAFVNQSKQQQIVSSGLEDLVPTGTH